MNWKELNIILNQHDWASAKDNHGQIIIYTNLIEDEEDPTLLREMDDEDFEEEEWDPCDENK